MFPIENSTAEHTFSCGARSVSPFLATASKIDDPRSLPKYHQLGAEMDLAQTEEWLKGQWF